MKPPGQATSSSPDAISCSHCGDPHGDIPLAFHTNAPDVWSPQFAGTEGCELTDETCVIHNEHFFVRGLILLPIIDHGDNFEWGVWVSLSEENFWRTVDTWEEAGRENAPPMFGWLCTELTAYPEITTNLRTMVHTQPVGNRPLIEVEPTEHLLAQEQQSGLTWAAAEFRSRNLAAAN